MQSEKQPSLLERLNGTRGKAAAFLRAAIGHQGDDCIIWPYSKNPVNGYGHFGMGPPRAMYAVHRVMCEITHGPKPTPDHLAAHGCHKRACINPNHLSWKTHSENMLDKRENGTSQAVLNYWGRKGKLTVEQAADVLALKGKETQAKTAARFSITESNVRKIQNGDTWSARIAALRAA